MARKVTPLDPRRMRLRRPDERTAMEIADEVTEEYGFGPEAARRVAELVALEEAKFSAIH